MTQILSAQSDKRCKEREQKEVRKGGQSACGVPETLLGLRERSGEGD